MSGLWELELELSRKEAVAAAERKLARPLTELERTGIQNMSSLLQLKSCVQAFASPAYTPAKVLADLESFTKNSNRD